MTIAAVRSMIVAATLGSRAAVCSSRSSRLGSAMVAMSSDIAWRCPPESLLTPALRRCSRPMPSRESWARMISRRGFVTPRRRPLRWERRREMARFSSIVIDGAVPARGSWKTRPIMRLRTCSACLVTSLPPSTILPPLTGKAPATPFSSVDLPDPLEPMMLTNCPAGTWISMPFRATTSLAVPGKKTLRSPRTSRVAGALTTAPPCDARWGWRAPRRPARR